MKKLFILIVSFLFIQGIYAQESSTLKQVLTLNPTSYGTGNGASVVWHPVQKMYYTVRAGNKTFPIDFFTEKGQKVSDGNAEAMFDVRGMWYDKKKKMIAVNGYNDFGWALYVLNDGGKPISSTSLISGMNQPEANSVGCSNGKGSVYFLSGYTVKEYKLKKGKLLPIKDVVTLSGAKGNNAAEFYNEALVYTGIKNQEFGLYNQKMNQVHLFSKKSGQLTKILELPKGFEKPTSFNFAYTNGIYFIYDKSSGEWKGFQ